MEGQLDLQNLTLCCHTHSHDSDLINPPLPPALTVVVGSSWSPCFFFLTPSVWSLRQLVSSHSEWKPSLHREQETLQDTATTSPPWPHLLPSPLCSLLSMQTPLFAVPGAHCACSHLGTRAMGCFLCLVSFSPRHPHGWLPPFTQVFAISPWQWDLLWPLCWMSQPAPRHSCHPPPALLFLFSTVHLNFQRIMSLTVM